MSIHAGLPTTSKEFLLWNEGREGKREFAHGKVVEQERDTTRAQARLKTNLLFALVETLDREKYEVGSFGFAVQTVAGVRFPDLIVEVKTSESNGSDIAAIHPVMLVEVPSPSSYARDFGEKVHEYQQLKTLQLYLVLSEDEPRAWLWSRDGEEWSAPEMILGHDRKLELSAFTTSLSMAGLYCRVTHSQNSKRNESVSESG
jgi:Uma2 family endonuclease